MATHTNPAALTQINHEARARANLAEIGAEMQKPDWLTILWSVWTVALAFAVVYFAFSTL